MKELQSITIDQITPENHTWYKNLGGWIRLFPTDGQPSEGWYQATDEEAIRDFIRSNSLEWGVNIYVPTLNQFEDTQGYSYFTRQLENGLLNYGVKFTNHINESTDLILVLTSVWVGASNGYLVKMRETADRSKKPLAMFTMWESNEWMEAHRQEMELLDFLIVPTTWNRDCLIKQGFTKPVFVCPLPVNNNFNYIERPQKRETFNFLHYNAGDYRKGFPEYIEAFLNEFTTENVKLTLKVRANSYEKQNLEPYKNQAKIEIINKTLNLPELITLQAQSECFVFPSKGEGWGYPPMEALMAGNPVIMPNAHSFKDWWTFGCVKVKTTLEPATFSIAGEVQEGTGTWYKPDVKDIQKQMRYVYEEYQAHGRNAEVFQNAKKGGERIKNKYTERYSASILIDILRKNKLIK
jgi:glycosyltransferase involved in cell wall biosynthesis